MLDVLLPVALGQEHLDRLADDLRSGVAKKALRLRIYEIDNPLLVHDHHSVRSRFE